MIYDSEDDKTDNVGVGKGLLGKYQFKCSKYPVRKVSRYVI